MEARAESGGGVGWRLWALVPVVLLAIAVAFVIAQGDRVVDLVGAGAPPADEFDVRRVQLRPGEIRVQVRNPQRDDLTIASVTVDDAIVPFALDGPETCSGLPVARYSPAMLARELGDGFALVESVPHQHHTPRGTIQSFQYSRFSRVH